MTRSLPSYHRKSDSTAARREGIYRLGGDRLNCLLVDYRQHGDTYVSRFRTPPNGEVPVGYARGDICKFRRFVSHLRSARKSKQDYARRFKPGGLLESPPWAMDGHRSMPTQDDRLLRIKIIEQYRSIKSELRLFKFLTGLNEKYDWVRREILKEDPYPSVDEVYGWVKREAARFKIMPPASNSPTVVEVDSSSGVGLGFGANEYPPPPRSTANRRGNNKPDKSKLWCSHCGMNKHTKENCFQLVGYPDWWEEEKAAKAEMAVGTEGAEMNHETAQIQKRRP